jgi:hypothetical protein
MKFNFVIFTCLLSLAACGAPVVSPQSTRGTVQSSSGDWENLALKSPEEMLHIMYAPNKTGGFSFNVEEHQRSFGGVFRKLKIYDLGNHCGLTNSYAYDRDNFTPILYVSLGEKNVYGSGQGTNSLRLNIYGYSRDVSEYRTSPSPGSILQKGGYVSVGTDDGVSYNSAEVASNCHITVNALHGRVYGTFRCQGLHKKVGQTSLGQTPSHVALEGSFDCDLNVTLKTR